MRGVSDADVIIHPSLSDLGRRESRRSTAAKSILVVFSIRRVRKGVRVSPPAENNGSKSLRHDKIRFPKVIDPCKLQLHEATCE